MTVRVRTMTQKYDGFVPGSHEIEGFGAGGFRFADMSHRGSILVLPSGICAWDVATTTDITPQSLQRVLDEPKGSVELLLIGTGEFLLPIRAEVRAALKEAGIGIDLMASAHAIATYNILFAEKRRVAAALLAVS
jgi:uncharacterized protein